MGAPTEAAAPAWRRRRNRFKERLRAGERPLAMWVTTPWEAVPEILGAASLDAALIDLEHVSHNLAQAERLVVACDAAGLTPIVRPASHDPHEVSRILDAGAAGIVFPRIETAEQAEAAVASMRYPPRGTRGWGGAHTRYALFDGNYGAGALAAGGSPSGVYTPQYVADADEYLLTILLVESVRGVENAEAIVAVDGVDAVVFGMGDHSVEVDFDWPRCLGAQAALRAACRARGIGVALAPPELAGDEFYPGCFGIVGCDSLLMAGALNAAVADARAAAAVPAGVAP